MYPRVIADRSVGVYQARNSLKEKKPPTSLLQNRFPYDSTATHDERKIYSRIPEHKVFGKDFFHAAIGFNIGTQKVITFYDSRSIQFHCQGLLIASG